MTVNCTQQTFTRKLAADWLSKNKCAITETDLREYERRGGGPRFEVCPQTGEAFYSGKDLNEWLEWQQRSGG